jgi:hypothetical protein
MTNALRILLVLAGYGLAIAIAVGTVFLRQSMTPADPASAGMSAFGDAILFLLVLAVCAVPPTLLAAYFVYRRMTTRTH